jgi:cytochrome c5
LCFSCHDSGVAGAPKLGDKAAWAPRIATGNDAMYATSLNGKGAMPAKGGNPALSDAEVKAAVDFMVAQSK